MMDIYSLAIWSMWAIFALYWLVMAFGNKRIIHRGSRIFQYAVVVAAYLVYRYAGLWRGGMQSIPENTFIRVAGLVVCAAGLAITIWARRTIGRNWSGNPTIKEGHELIRTGPYSVVRHPIYTGLLVMFLGTGVTAGRYVYFALLGFVAVMFYIKLKIEESLMLRTFPVEYPEYKKTTKALVPFVI